VATTRAAEAIPEGVATLAEAAIQAVEVIPGAAAEGPTVDAVKAGETRKTMRGWKT
jgi:hypothetical protein